MKRLRTAYLIAANTAILMVLVELGAHIVNRGFQRLTPALSYAKLSEPARRNYAHMKPAEVDDLLRVTGALRFRYAPAVGFVHEATTSRFVNIDAYGIRSNGTAHRDIAAMQDAVWFFGGSAAFGYGVADHETIPAQLERIVARPVINLGVRSHATRRETRLLNYYLRIGYRPAVAVFLDGINETCEPDPLEDELSQLVTSTQEGYSWQFGRPVVYAYARISRKLKRLAGVRVNPPDPFELNCPQAGNTNPLRVIHERALAEREALCSLYRIQCRTFVQPFAGIHGRHDDPAFLESISAADLKQLFGHLEPSWRAAGAVFITGVLDGSDRHAYVDHVHYSADASRLIAAAIAVNLPATAATTAPAAAAAPPP